MCKLHLKVRILNILQHGWLQLLMDCTKILLIDFGLLHHTAGRAGKGFERSIFLVSVLLSNKVYLLVVGFCLIYGRR